MKTDQQKLLDGALKLLAARPHSRQEILNYLSRKSSDPVLVDQVVAKLDKLKLLDDQEFSRWLVESRSRSRPRGKRLLMAELKSKGIDSDIITAAVTADDEASLAAQALQKKLRLWQDLPYRDFHTKAGRYLASRGFSWDTIEPVIKKRYNELHVS